MSNADVISNAISQIRARFANVSKANLAKVDTVCATLMNAKVQELFIAQDVKVDELTDLYEVMRVVRFFKEISADTFDAARCDENMIVSVKTLLNAQDIDETVTKADLHAAICDSKNARAHVYQRKTKISADRQVTMCVSALKLANLQARDTLKARDCEALKIAREKLKNVVLL